LRYGLDSAHDWGYFSARRSRFVTIPPRLEPLEAWAFELGVRMYHFVELEKLKPWPRS
jgi:hypothetical protein